MKASPDRSEYVREFEKRLKLIKEFLPNLKDHKIYGIYAALNMHEKTLELLTKGICTMIVKGDILEIVNLDKVKYSD